MLFADLPDARRVPPEPIVRAAEMEGNYRWTLRRAWGSGPCILWCGLNPSTADGKRDDPTMWREMCFSYRWGFGSLVKVNLYPFISANQDALRKWRASFDGEDRGANDAWLANMDAVRQEIAGSDRHMAAWGNGADPDDLSAFLEEIATDYESWDRAGHSEDPPQIKIDWYCLGTNGDGSPRHTLARGRLRIPDDATPILWRAAA